MTTRILSIHRETRPEEPARRPIPGLAITVPARPAGEYVTVEIDGPAGPMTLGYGPAPLLPFPATEAELLERAEAAQAWSLREGQAEGA